jgi:hypothetical protein
MLNRSAAARRRYLLAASAAGMLVSGGLALAIIGSLVSSRFWTGPLGLATGIGCALSASGMACLSGLCLRANWFGPSTKPKGVVYSSDWVFFACLSAITLVLATGIVGALYALGDGRSDSAFVLRMTIAWLGLYAFPCALGSIKVGGRQLTQGTSSLRMESEPVLADQTLSAVLEIPFSVDCAPMLDLDLRLTRTIEPVASPEAGSTTTVIWRALERIEAFEPVGTRRSRVRIDIDLDVPTPSEFDGVRAAYLWRVTARPVSAHIMWSAHFDVPVQFKDMVAR